MGLTLLKRHLSASFLVVAAALIAAASASGRVTVPAPTGLHAVSASTDRVRVDWNAAGAGVVAYRIRRDGVSVATTTDTAATVGLLECDRTFTISVERASA